MIVNRPGEPAYAGLATFSKAPLVLDPSQLSEGDVAIMGVPIDESVSNRPGARFGPRAIRTTDDGKGLPPSRWRMELGLDPCDHFAVVDHGDLEVVAGHPEHNLARLREWVSEVLARGARPVLLGGDHSLLRATVPAAVDRAPVGLIQFDAHADTADIRNPARAPWSHGSVIRELVESGQLPGSRVVQIGLRGAWPGAEEFEWAREQGVHWETMDSIRQAGSLDDAVGRALARLADVEHVWVSFDIDAVDPVFAPGTGTPEPGGLGSYEALRAVRRVAAEKELLGFEVVEVSPPYDVAGITALLANRLVIEALTGMALQRARGGRQAHGADLPGS